MALLKLSILEDGWTTPIVTLPELDGRYQIVDRFHRWKVSADLQVYDLTNLPWGTTSVLGSVG